MQKLISHLAKEPPSFKEVLIVLARIAAATPHSADVERSISANNLIKTPGRSCFNIASENKWLFIHFNLPPLSNWDPRKAVVEWLKQKERRELSSTIAASEYGERKTTSQSFFKGIFDEASLKRKFGIDVSLNGEEDLQQSAKKSKICFKKIK